jgi:uncharacterized integral membrane protein (TIGR00698 family)
MSQISLSRRRRLKCALEKTLIGIKVNQSRRLLPGLLAAVLLAWLSIWSSQYIGVSLMGFTKSPISAVMMAVLLGMIVGNATVLPEPLQPGLMFTVKNVLRLGIILLGIRLSLFDVLKLGALGVPIVLLCILGALFFTTRLSKWLKLPARLGTLVAVGTSICGVSAIVATGPAIEAKDEEVAYAVAVITIFGIFATLVYPYAANILFDGDAVKAGLFMGTSIHDTSQVTGAALVFADVFSSPRALDGATVTKLVRNVFMAFVIPLMALYYARGSSGSGDAAEQFELTKEKTPITKLMPLFIVGFLVFATLRSIGDAGISAGGEAFGLWNSAEWKAIHNTVQNWSVNLLVVALAAVGLNTRLSLLKGLGVKPFAVGLGAALVVGVLSYAAISLLGRFLAF